MALNILMLDPYLNKPYRISKDTSGGYGTGNDFGDKFFPSILSMVTIILCMYSLSNVMKVIPIGITYASFAGLTIIATSAVGIIKYNQTPNLYGTLGLVLIIVGVVLLNVFGKVK